MTRCLRRIFHGLVFFGRVNLPAKKHEMDLKGSRYFAAASSLRVNT
jgi:hypothetical protein